MCLPEYPTRSASSSCFHSCASRALRKRAPNAASGLASGFRLEHGVGKIAAHLNGHSYIDGYDALNEEAAA